MKHFNKKPETENQHQRISRQKGFTLIELLVVISIIALLVSILLPSLNSARELAKGMKCITNLRSIGMGIQFYCEDFDGKLPFGCDPWPSSFTWTLQNYTQATPDPSPSKGVSDSVYWCPSLQTHNPTSGWPGDYGLNYHLFADNMWDASAPRKNIGEFQNPGEFAAFVDGGSWIRLEEGYASNELNRIRVTARHGNVKADDDGKVNVLWIDTHVSSEDWDTIAGGDDDTYLRYWNN